MMKKIIIISFGMVALMLNTQAAPKGDPRYPAEWWKPIPRDQAASWEILPQDAKPGEVILSKRTSLGILSNFGHTPFKFRKKSYESLEGFWQMMKYPEGPTDERAVFPGLIWTLTRQKVSQLIGFEAKDAGKVGSENMKKMQINWVTFEGVKMKYRVTSKGSHYNIIKQAMWAKVRQNKKVKDILLKTGDLVLKPDHKQKPNTPPAWRYYKILTEIREKLKNPSN